MKLATISTTKMMKYPIAYNFNFEAQKYIFFVCAEQSTSFIAIRD